MTKADSKKLPPSITFHDDDRSVELRLRVIPDQEPRVVTLAEPGIMQVAQIQTILQRVDDKLPKVPDLPSADAEPAARNKMLTAYNEAVAEQQKWITGEDLPYATALHEIITMLAPEEEVSLDDLPPGVSNPDTARKILQHYKAPLPGLDGA